MSEEVPNLAAAQAESAVEATGESRDLLKHQDGDIRQRRRPQSAYPQRQEQGGNRRRGVNRSWPDRPPALGSGRRSSYREGYRPPRHDSKHASNRGGGHFSINDKRMRKGRDKELVNQVNSKIEPGTSYNGNAVHVPNLDQDGDSQMQAVSECFQNRIETVLARKGTSGSSESSDSAVNFSDPKEHQEKLSRAMDSCRGNEMSQTGKFKERDARSKGQSRGGWRGRNYSQDRISHFYTRSGANNNMNTSNINKEMGNGNEENSNFHEMFYLNSQADNDQDVRAMYRSPQCCQNPYHEPNMTEPSKYARGHRREQRPEAKEAVKSSRPGRRGDFSYRSQQESIVRALSHLNPVQSSQASALIEQLRNEAYECMVCCEGIRCKASVWSCQNCYHVFHLGCVRKWARSPAASVEAGERSGWRCPACQNITSEIPSVYKCFCGKVIDPAWRRHEGLTPHSCGELCSKKRDSLQCPHNCNQLCHPGPCPSCPVMVTKACPCGRTTNRVRCGQRATVLCKLECNKVLNCLTHRCKRICHPDPCGDCSVKVQQTCYCGKQQRETLCGTGEPGGPNVDGKSGYFSCQDKCLRILDCGNHRCQGICHRGWCTKCLLKPQLVTHCPCGKTPLNHLLGEGNSRKSCLDPVPTCPLMCGKILPCSPQKDEADLPEEHRCKRLCHLGDCGPCDGITTVRCRCGTNTKEIPCIERHLEEYTCDQRCNKKKQCGRHRCNQKCCMDTDHRCELVCGKKLRCGYHKCLEPCHPGYCPPCLMSGFDELTCHCGASVLYPPIPCGTLPPECNKPCSRAHSCSHPVTHSCHSEEVCPPCTVLTKKKCMGDHEVRHNIPCHVSEVSCGKVCGKVLPCGHKCAKICHKPPCLLEEESCLQPCEIPRKECGHPCSSHCHANKECPPVPCRVKVVVTCKCGRRAENFPCLQGGEKMVVAQAFQRLTTETLADKMKDLQSGHSVDTSSIMNVDSKKPRQLECNNDCALYERNRRLAEALNIENPDLSQFTPVRYSPFLLAEAKQNLPFIKSVEDTLENLVQTTLKMSSSQRSHSFSPMNSNHRRLVHELSMFYNCASRSYDQEPKRNTVVTATKSSHLPSVKLSTQIEREINPPPPHPIPYLPSQMQVQSKPPQEGQKKTKTWAQVPDYFADDFED